MSPHIRRTRRLRRDIVEQALHIDEHNPDAATRFLGAIESAIKRIATHPEIGAARSFQHPALADVRLWPIPGFPRHLMFYRYRDGELRVLRLLHASRDIEAVLLDRPEPSE